MTRDEILTMPAGTEMDAAVGHFVLGMDITRVDYAYWSMVGDGKTAPGTFRPGYHTERPGYKQGDDPRSRWIPLPQWSTNHDDMVTLAGQIAADHGWSIGAAHDPKDLPRIWSATVGGVTATGPSLALAVCRAALLARA